MNLRKYVIGLHQQIRRLTSFKIAYMEWSDKTEWVQDSAHWSELGKHRADVISERMKRLSAENESLRKDSERYRYASLNLIDLGSWTDEEIDAAISSPENH